MWIDNTRRLVRTESCHIFNQLAGGRCRSSCIACSFSLNARFTGKIAVESHLLAACTNISKVPSMSPWLNNHRGESGIHLKFVALVSFRLVNSSIQTYIVRNTIINVGYDMTRYSSVHLLSYWVMKERIMMPIDQNVSKSISAATLN